MLERLIAASYIRPKSSYYTLSIVRAHSAVREHFALVQYQCTGYTARPTSSTSPLGYLSYLVAAVVLVYSSSCRRLQLQTLVVSYSSSRSRRHLQSPPVAVAVAHLQSPKVDSLSR